MLDKNFPQFKIRENYRPDWLISSDSTWLELDFYIEEINVAFEVQGEQHYRFVSFFHKTPEDFEKRKKHDQEKKDLCYGRGVKLKEILTATDAQIAIKEIEEKFCVPPKFSYGNDAPNMPSNDLLRKVKMARRAILRKATQANRIDGLVVKAVRLSMKEGFDIFEKEIVDYYKENQERIDSQIKVT